MKEIKISVVLFLSCFIFTYAQSLKEIEKVESPYRLIKGVVLKSNLTMTTLIPNKVIWMAGNNEIGLEVRGSNRNVIYKSVRKPIYPYVLSPQDYRYIQRSAAIVIDGALVKQN